VTPVVTLTPGTVEGTVPPGATEAAGTVEPTVGARSTIPPSESYPVVVPTLPPGLTLGEKRLCPEGWRRISDDKANYSLCLPPGWAILDPDSSEPSTRTTMHFESAAILSPEAFPYPYTGSYEKGIRDLIRDSEKNVIWMQIFFFQTDEPDQPMSCDAKPAGTLGVLPSVSCENHFNIPSGTDRAVTDPEGEWGRLFVAVPLPSAGVPPSWESSPYSTSKGGYSFAVGILFEGRNEALAHYHDVIMQILDTLEGQP